ncbi:MAG: sialidase family protein [Anaerolineae bacterium]
MQHGIVYREAGRYAGWPANYGIWSWGQEIVVGFTVGYVDPQGGFHTRDRARPQVTMQARSMDGGETWETGKMPCHTPGGRALSADEHMAPELRVANVLDGELQGPLGGFDFAHPDFALMCARSGLRAGAVSWFYVSYDRCRTWAGPYRLPGFDLAGIAARTDYTVSDAQTCTLYLTAAKEDGEEGHVFCARTVDGGASFAFRSWIGPEPAGYSIMPATVCLPSGRSLTAVRRREGERCWIELYASDDDALTWQYAGRPVDDTGRGGNPPAMVRLRDGRLCLAYGYRDPPYGMRARLSEDGGLTWSAEISLRDGAGNHDIGYPRAAQRPDGQVVVVYYWNEDPAGERYIASTTWSP